MTKREREKAEREKLKNMLEEKPRLKQIIDALIDKPKPELMDVLKPTIEEALKEQRMVGVMIGFQGALLKISSAMNNIKTPEEFNNLKNEWLVQAEKIKNDLGIKYGTIDEIKDNN